MDYFTDILLPPHGVIEASHCECPAGSGMTAHCKHVLALLWAVEQMVREGKIQTEQVTPQKLQSFDKPNRLYFGPPIKAENLPGVTKKQLKKLIDTPVNSTTIDTNKLREKVRNQLCCK